jgi:ethanolamine utilization protein EutQ (cupin superfamily)
MAKTPEGLVKKQIMQVLAEHNAYYVTPMSFGFGNSGVPDVIAVVKGRFIGIEAKAGKNKPTALQLKNLKDIQESGGIALVINEHNIDELKAALEGL